MIRRRFVGIGGGVLTASVALLLATTAQQATGQPADENGEAGPAIVGGQPVSETYSWMVSVQDSNGHLCGGSLIKPEWVVTAAHCVGGVTQVRIGTTNRNSGGTVARIASEQRHPSSDIAVLKLDQAVQEEPITIAADGGSEGTATRLIGWGSTTGEQDGGTDQLMQVDVQVTSGCTNRFDAQTELCLGDDDPNTSACYGDSGGPSVIQVDGQWQLTGATNRAGQSKHPCQDNEASIYASVPAHKQWIDEVTGGAS